MEPHTFAQFTLLMVIGACLQTLVHVAKLRINRRAELQDRHMTSTFPAPKYPRVPREFATGEWHEAP